MKVQVVFQNLEKSDFIRTMINERVESVLSKFPQSDVGKATVYVGMDNSPQHTGANQFHVKILWNERKGNPIILEKKSTNLYEATAAVVDRLLERVHRVHDRAITKRRGALRQLKRTVFYEQPSPAA